jgi:hypothetical protein
VGEDEAHYPIFNTDLSGVDFVVDYCNNVCHLEPQINREQVFAAMTELGFGKERAADPGACMTNARTHTFMHTHTRRQRPASDAGPAGADCRARRSACVWVCVCVCVCALTRQTCP